MADPATMPDENAAAPESNPLVALLAGNRRYILIGAALLMLAGFAGLILWSGEPPYRPLYVGMSDKDAAAIVAALQKEHIPYKLEGSGTVLVPSDQVHAARLKLAGQEITPGSGTGFELFDKKSEFGLSEFSQKVNLLRATQGELARTIEVLPQVAAARIHIVMPRESAFAERERKASASVMLQLRGGEKLPPKSVTAIQNLVAASVPDLERSAVTVVDSNGTLLSKNDEQPGMAQSDSLQEYQSQVERRLEERLTGMLEQVVGAGQAVVRVTAEINRESVEQQSQRFNPDEQVMRSEHLVEESRSNSDPASLGIPGMASNSPPNMAGNANNMPPAPAAASESSTRNESTRNYEISSTNEHRVIPFGEVDRLSVAVIVGGSFEKPGDLNSFVPRNAQQLNGLKTLVQRAVGFSEERGDTVEVQSLPLLEMVSGEEKQALSADADRSFYLEIARYGLMAVALLLLAWFLLRPLAKLIASGGGKRPGTAGYGGRERNEPGMPGMPGGGPIGHSPFGGIDSVERVRAAVTQEPERASKVLKEWVGP